MIKWEITTNDLTPREAEALSAFWHGGHGHAVGFRINVPSVTNRTYKETASRRSLAEQILKALEKKEDV